VNRNALGSLAVAAAILLACPSKEERLLAKKQDLRVLLDELYASYRPPAEKPPAQRADEAGGAVGHFVAELDRTAFEAHCLAIGRGDRPFSLSERIDAFTREPANAERCRKAARLEVEIDALERELGKP
jgi:hypothetical protein